MLFNIIETYLLFFELEAIARFFFFGSFIECFYLAQFHLQSLLSIRKLDTTSVKTVHGKALLMHH